MAPRSSIDPEITLGELFLFLNIAFESRHNQLKAMGRVAADLKINPSRVTTCVDRLDERFGCLLIEKGEAGRRNGKLTFEGRQVAAFASIIGTWYDYLVESSIDPQVRWSVMTDQVRELEKWRNSNWGANPEQPSA